MRTPRRFSQKKSAYQKKAAKSGGGFTLIEVLVTISVFLIVIVVIYSIQVFSQKVYRKGEMTTEILQNGRVMLERVSRDLRQAKYIATSLPEIPDDITFPAPSEILFQDGHLPPIVESDYAAGGGQNTIALISAASSENDYYNYAFLKIVQGTGSGQIRRIISYDGQTKIATVDENWGTVPVAGVSKYRIDASYYYIRYWKDGNNNLKKQIIGYCFPDECSNFIFAPWNAKFQSQTLYQLDSKIVLKDEDVGEFLTDLKFWGLKAVNVSLILQESGEEIELRTEVFGRNI